MAKPIFVRGIAPSMAGGPCRPRSSSKIIAPNRGALVFFNELRKFARISLMGGSFCVENGEGIEALAKPIFVRGVSPFNGWHAPCLAGAPCALFIQNHYAKSGSFGFSERTLCVITNLSCGRFVFCWERSEDRSIGKANLRKGRQPLQWKCASHPSMAGAPRAFVENGEGIEVLAKPIFVRAQPFNGSGTAAPFNGRYAPCLVGMPHARLAPYWVRI